MMESMIFFNVEVQPQLELQTKIINHCSLAGSSAQQATELKLVMFGFLGHVHDMPCTG